MFIRFDINSNIAVFEDYTQKSIGTWMLQET